LSFDLEASLRRLRPEKRSGSLAHRDDAALTFVGDVALVGPDLLLDTCVTIDTLQNRAPLSVDAIREARVIHHSAVALAELTHLFGRLDPNHRDTAGAIRSLKRAISVIPDHRLAAPSIRASAEAGILAGMVARLSGRTHDQALLNDALLHCQAIEQGHTLLTGNIRDFDLFDQILPGRIIFYRR
jgi:predicted nucleic acid-binding protein